MKQVTPHKNIHIQLGEVNSAALAPHSFAQACERDYQEQLEALADRVVAGGYRVIMLAGPSSSGKTTTANKIGQCLEQRGISAPVVSLDDFFLGTSLYPKLPDGSPDMESVEALDLNCINTTFARLLEHGTADFPLFDFTQSCRSNSVHTITLGEKGILIVEGLHAINPRLTHALDNGQLFKAYVSTRTQYMQGETPILVPKDNRLIRRIVRDHNFRGKNPLQTLKSWSDVLDGEMKYIYPFRDEADLKIDSAMNYEGCIFHHYLMPILADITDPGEYGEKITQLLNILEAFDDIDYECIPTDSLLREFIGK